MTAIQPLPSATRAADPRGPVSPELYRWLMGLLPVVQWDFVDVAAAYSAGPGEFLRVNASAAPRTVTLPSAARCPGRRIGIKAIDATNTITVAAASGETVDNAANVTLTATNQYREVLSDGLEWWTV